MLSHGLELTARSLLVPFFLAARWMIPRASCDGHEVPTAHPCLALDAKVALDELFLSSEVILASLVSSADCRRITAEVAAALELYEGHGWLDEPARYHCTPPTLVSPQLTRRECGRLHFQHLQFDSGYAPHPGEPGRVRWLGYAANRTAHAWVLEHRGGPRPWLICIPGYRMGVPRWDFLGLKTEWFYLQLGLNVVVPVLPFHGPRAVGRRSGDGFLCGDHLDTVHALAQAVWDVRRIVSWVRGRGAPAVGVYGISLGGCTTALITSLDQRLDCVIAGIPVVDFSRLAHCHLPPILLWLAERLGLVSADVERLQRVVSPLALAPRVARRRRYLYAGMVDRLVPPDQVRDLWHRWGRPRITWYEGGHLWFLGAKEVRGLLLEALETSGLLPAGANTLRRSTADHRASRPEHRTD